MPENTVQAFAQTTDGFLWVGTTGGLARFDGSGFDYFDHTNTRAFTESSILSLLRSKDGDLWVGTDGGGIVRLHRGVFSRIGEHTPLERAFIRVLFEDKLGYVWAGTDDGLYRSEGTDGRTFKQVAGIPSMRVEAIEEDLRGRIWVGGEHLYVIEAGVASEEKFISLRKDQVKAIRRTQDGSIWLGTLQGLWRARRQDPSFSRVSAIAATVRSITEVDGGSLWVGTSRDGVYVVHGDEATPLKTPASIISSSVYSVFQDRSSNVWLGTPAGMLRATPSAISIIHLPEMSASEFGTVYLDKYGTLWVASRDLYKVRGEVSVRVPFPQLKGAAVRNVVMAEDGTLWFGTDREGVFHLAPGHEEHYTTDQGLISNSIRVLIQTRDGSIWIGTDAGLSQLRDNTIHNFGVQDGLCDPEVHAVVEDTIGDIWVGTSLGLNHLHRGHFVQDSVTQELRSEKVWSISSMPEGAVLFGTRHGGLYEYKSGHVHHFTVAQGLSSDSIYKMLPDHQRDNLWLSGPDGISRVRLHSLDDLARGTTQELSSRTYYIADGANTVQFYGGMQPAGAMSPSGEVWFPSNRGLVHIAMDDSVADQPPPLRIKRVMSDGEPVEADKPIRLPADSATLEVDYAPILLGPQGSMRYRYKFEGVDKDWTNALSRTVAYYTSIPAGKHRLLVQGYEADRPEVFSEASLVIDKKRHFYRTWWFLTVLALFLATVFWTMHLLKVRSVNARFSAILEERGRLAREIHDTVLQGCASVSSLLEASASAESEPALRKKLVEYARSQIGTTTNEARSAVWNLRRTSEQPKSIHQSIDELSSRTSGEFGIPVATTFAGVPEMLDGVMTHEIVMVIREALYNSLVHGKARSVEISTTSHRGTLSVAVRDDGKGFDPLHASEDGHYGLVGMKERIERLGGSITINSHQGGGTEVLLKVSTRSGKSAGGSQA